MLAFYKVQIYNRNKHVYGQQTVLVSIATTLQGVYFVDGTSLDFMKEL